MIHQSSLKTWAEFAYDVAERAGKVILEYYQQSITPSFKKDGSPLTIADKAAHDLIFKELSPFVLDANGAAPVLSEEGEMPTFEERQMWHRYWSVDPLDGTREFLAHNDEFSVNIALVVNHKPVVGIIYIPVQKVGYLAWQGGGAYRCKEGSKPERIVTRIPSSKPLRIIMGHRRPDIATLPSWLSTLGESTISHQGSSLKFCTLANGEADLFLRLSPTSEWDNAAGQCLLEEAGGIITTLDFETIPYNQSGTLRHGSLIAMGDPALRTRILPFSK